MIFVCYVFWRVLVVVLIMLGSSLMFFSFLSVVFGRMVWIVVCKYLLSIVWVKLLVRWIVSCLNDMICMLCWCWCVVLRCNLCIVKWLGDYVGFCYYCDISSEDESVWGCYVVYL